MTRGARGEILAQRTRLFEVRLVGAEEPDLQVINNDHAARGMGRSGSVVQQRHERRLQTLKAILAERIRLEKDVQEYPLTPADETTWFVDLQESLGRIVSDQERRLANALMADYEMILGSGGSSVVQDAVRQIQKLGNEYLYEAEVINGEREHRKKALPAPPPSNIVLNISNSQIAGLNVAGVVGTLEASLTTIQTGGERGIAEALKALAEAIAADSALSNEVKAESLAHVSAMGEELARPPEQRRVGVLRTLAGGLVGLIGHADKVFAVYEILKTAAGAAGYELP
jgi:hypothetical protein